MGVGAVLFIAGGQAPEGSGGVGSRDRCDFKPTRLRDRRYANAFRSPERRGKRILPSRLDFYLEQVIDLYDQIADLGVSYWVTGGFYAKQKVFDTVTDLEGDLITLSVRTRTCATSKRQLPTGPPKEGPGAPKHYDGKINRNDPRELTKRFEEIGRLPDRPQVRILTTVANSPHFGRDLRVVLLMDPEGEQVILASTHAGQHAEEAVRYYLSAALPD